MKKPRIVPGILLLIASVVISILTYQDYGIGWDEASQREIGAVTYSYVFEKDTTLNHFVDKDHGAGFELPLVIIEKEMGITDWRDIFLMRHIVTNVFFLLGCFFGYLLALRLFKKQWLACLGFLMLAFHPRLYGHSFFNSKDIPFLVMYTVCFLVAHIAFEKRKWGWMLLLGALVGYTTSVRLLSILLAAILALVILVDMMQAVLRKEKVLPSVIHLFSFIIGFCVTLYLAWPALWSSPVASFIEFYESLSHFRWNGWNFFMGKFVDGNNLPSTYLPVWFAITTPILWLTLGVAGIAFVLVHFFRQPRRFINNTNERHFLVYVICTLMPVAMVIYLHSVVYDDWRHVYFIYPSFVMLALYTLSLVRTSLSKKIMSYAIVLQIFAIAWDMYRLHPFEPVYFSRLVSHEKEFLRMNYEGDYWGAGNKQALEYLVAHCPDSIILIRGNKSPLPHNAWALQVQDRPRIKFVNEEEAVYDITFFRGHPEDYPWETYYDIKRQNSTVVRIHKLR